MNPQAPVIILTRPENASERFASQLRQSGIDLEIVISPALEIIPVSFQLPDDCDGAIFTSVNGVRSTPGCEKRAWCVGNATAKEAARRGWRAISANGDAEVLFQKIVTDAPSGQLCHFRGLHSRGNLAARLNAEGIATREIVAYRQDRKTLSDEARKILMGNQQVILPLFSPKSAATVARQGPFRTPVHVVAMSPAVAEEARTIASKGLLISRAPNAKAMVAAINHVAEVACFVEDNDNTA